MTEQYTGGSYPDVLFARDFLIPAQGYPSSDPDSMYDPRSLNGLTLNCHIINGGTDPDETPESPDGFLEPSELAVPGSLTEQILGEMARSRFTSSGASEASSLSSNYDDEDIFAIDGDSRDTDTKCNQADIGNNMNPYTVRNKEGSILWADYNLLEPHIRDNLNNTPLNQQIYVNPSVNTRIHLTPGKTYTLIVGGTGGSKGNYELRIRKMNPSNLNEAHIVLTDANKTVCDREL